MFPSPSMMTWALRPHGVRTRGKKEPPKPPQPVGSPAESAEPCQSAEKQPGQAEVSQSVASPVSQPDSRSVAKQPGRAELPEATVAKQAKTAEPDATRRELFPTPRFRSPSAETMQASPIAEPAGPRVKKRPSAVTGGSELRKKPAAVMRRPSASTPDPSTLPAPSPADGTEEAKPQVYKAGDWEARFVQTIQATCCLLCRT